MSEVKRRKPKKERKSAVILIRVTDEQKGTLSDAAMEAGLELSAWIRTVCLEKAKRG
jgi:uncharacterized protein (DUF1778 family)